MTNKHKEVSIQDESYNNKRKVNVALLVSILSILITAGTLIFSLGELSGKGALVDANRNKIDKLEQRIDDMGKLAEAKLQDYLDDNYGELSARDEKVDVLEVKLDSLEKKLDALEQMFRQRLIEE